MAENMIKFLRGNVANLPQTATAGAVYFTKDEGLYLGLEDGSFHRYGDFITVDDVASLPAAGAHETCMYYCVAENVLAKWDGSAWVQINKQKTLAELGGVAQSVYNTKMAALEKADSDNATAISDLADYVGTIPADANVDSVVAYVDKKTTGIATNAALSELQGKVATAEGEIDALQAAIGENGSVTNAIAAAKKAGDDAQADVDALETVVSEYKTSNDAALAGVKTTAEKGVADAATAKAAADAAAELAGKKATMEQVNAAIAGAGHAVKTEVDKAISDMDAAYKKADADLKTELEGKINAKADQTALDGVAGRVATIESDYLKAADKYNDTKVKEDIAANLALIEELQGEVDTLNADSETEGSVDYKIAQAVAAIMENPDDTMNSINELVTWINDHAADALELSNQVAANKDDIAALEGLVGTTGVAAQIEAAIAAALKVDGVDKYALASDLTAAIGRIAAMEAKVANWDAAEKNAKDYADQKIADLKIADYVKKDDADATYAVIGHDHDDEYDAKGDAAQALVDAKAYADGLAGNYATAAQGAKADTALQAADITTGGANGTISVKGTDVAVKGLGSAAYVATTAFDAAGTAETKANAAEAAAKAYADGLAVNYDAKGSADQALVDAKAYADQAETDAVTTANAYTDSALTWGSF